jgi:Tol biopolymer transport system component
MNARRDADRLITTWLTEIAPEGHVDYLDATLEAIDGLRQRPAWTSPGRWLLMQLTLPRVVVPRATRYLAVLALLLIAAIVAVAIAGGQRRLPAPFGLAAAGLISFESEGDLFVAAPNGTGRQPLVTGAGAQWGLVWSRRGDRIAFWSAPTTADPASLWVADGDGSNARNLTGPQTFVVATQLPAVTWSPDDQRLAFSTEDRGVLYVVNGDGTDLRSIGDESHERHDPSWSPDGTLIAYRGHPRGQIYTTSSWVITPDGRTDVQVIAPMGTQEFNNVNPSWSLDGRSIIVHTGGAGNNDISEARRDANDVWSDRVLIGGPTQDFHPSWSNAGTQFSFIRVMSEPGVQPESMALWVADADGSNAHQVSTVPITFAAQCWSPDDRFIRAFALGDAPSERTLLLIPVDGSPVVEIPAPGEASKGTCSTQRLAG